MCVEQDLLLRLVRNGADRLQVHCTPALERLVCDWLEEHLRAGGSFDPHFWGQTEDGRRYFTGGDVAPLVLLGAIHLRGAAAAWPAAWRAFVHHTAREVLAALRQRGGPLEVGPDAARTVEEGLVRAVRTLLAECEAYPPTVHCLKNLYLLAFADHQVPGPAELPSWWGEEVLPGEPLPPFPPPAGGPEPSRPDDDPWLAAPDEETRRQFIREEGQGVSELCNVLRGLADHKTALRRAGQPVSGLDFPILRYRVWRAADGDADATAELLLEALSAGGYTNSHGEAMTLDNLNQVLSRLRREARRRLRAALGPGVVHADWFDNVFPRPCFYKQGGLFPPLP